jgi:transcriptional regulator with XRE-family HTH domain
MSLGHHVNRTCEGPHYHRRVTRKPTPESMKEIGQRLHDARKKVGITQTALAQRAGVRQEALSKFENGGRGLEADNLLAVLRAAAEAGISVDDYVLRGIGGATRSEPLLVLTQDPALRSAVIQLGRALQEQEGEDDSSPSEPKIPSHKRR